MHSSSTMPADRPASKVISQSPRSWSIPISTRRALRDETPALCDRRGRHAPMIQLFESQGGASELRETLRRKARASSIPSANVDNIVSSGFRLDAIDRHEAGGGAH